ncbi:proton-dependent oligopeptide transporter (POT family) [Legionella moravica]|uniref:Proton-dependent oligopeptide transporter (POT family) n=1 Tax=Legionella moravica TaxID=39962 RepID=A0A378K0R6_9GAMM|nr:oligopeptide:H+ symporter [Legionella moravica]KTD31158.1 proton-dependent oligopeptide transporter (POT family) [Legionella moravica]STX63218.1 proton-dependent oligopeptide transporter (POT family) [Legionella moravica]
MSKLIPKMPRGVIPLYFIQGFSTFSFAVLYSSLALYSTKQLGLSNVLTNSIVGLFIAFNYILQLTGGLIGGRLLSNRCLFFITIIIQSMGIIVLALAQSSMLYLGLSLFLVGCGLNTTSLNSMLTQRFEQSDDRRETAFFINYSAMNLGFCAGYFASGFFDYSNQYQGIFYVCIMTNGVTLYLITKFWSALGDKNTPLMQMPTSQSRRQKKIAGLFSVSILVPAMFLCFHSTNLSNGIIATLSVLMFGMVLMIKNKQTSSIDKRNIMIYLILAVSTLLFWMIYLTGPMGVTLFIKNNVDKNMLGVELATQWIRNMNPIVIIIGAPLMAMMLNQLNAKGYTMSVPMQFVFAFIFLAGSFCFLSCGIIYANPLGHSHLFWVFGYIILQGLAELLIAPAGYALVGRLAPPQYQGILMGTWMMVSGVAASISQYFSNAMVRTEATNPLITNNDFYQVFKQLAGWSLSGALCLYCISLYLKKNQQSLEYS